MGGRQRTGLREFPHCFLILTLLVGSDAFFNQFLCYPAVRLLRPCRRESPLVEGPRTLFRWLGYCPREGHIRIPCTDQDSQQSTEHARRRCVYTPPHDSSSFSTHSSVIHTAVPLSGRQPLL